SNLFSARKVTYWNMKKIVLLFLLFLPLCSPAQDYTSGWEGFFSYFNVKDIDYGDTRIFAASENAIFSTQIGSGIQKEISTLQGLSGESISAIHYSEAYKLLIIGYVNGLIQIYHVKQETTSTFIDIQQKPTITPEERQINGFFETSDKLYIAANYGISAFDLSRMEFGDTYYI